MSATALVPVDGGLARREAAISRLPVAHDFTEMLQICEQLAKSGYFKDARDVSQAMVKVMLGQELGLSPVTSMMSIYIVEGKPSLSAQLMLALVKSSGKYDYRVLESTNDKAEIEWFEIKNRALESLGVSSFTAADATAAGLLGRPTWKSYRQDMLMWRAAARGFRRFTPDLAGGAPLYAKEEMDDMQGETVIVDDLSRSSGRSTGARPRMGRAARASVTETTATTEPVTTAEDALKQAQERLRAAYRQVTSLPYAGNNGEAKRFGDYCRRTGGTEKKLGDMDAAELHSIADLIEAVPSVRDRVFVLANTKSYDAVRSYLKSLGLELHEQEVLVAYPEWVQALALLQQPSDDTVHEPEIVEDEQHGGLFGEGE